MDHWGTWAPGVSPVNLIANIKGRSNTGPCVCGIALCLYTALAVYNCIGSQEVRELQPGSTNSTARGPGLEPCSAIPWLADLGQVLYFLMPQSLQLEPGTNTNT